MSAAASARAMLDPGRVVVVVIDLQQKLLPAIEDRDRILRNSLLLIRLAADAVGARTAENRAVGLRRMEIAGTVISSTEMAIYELLGRSDASAFKAMLPHLRG